MSEVKRPAYPHSTMIRMLETCDRTLVDKLTSYIDAVNLWATKLEAENRELRELAEEVVGEYGMNGSIERLEEFLKEKENTHE